MTVMEPRVAQRRKSVSEDRARKRLKWILIVIAVIALVLAALWLVRSPVLSIRQIEILGADQSAPRGAVRALDMDIGTPTIDVDGDALTAAILEDPWVLAATVEVIWPGSMVIEVSERTPVAPVLAGEQWVLVGSDSVVIMTVADPGPEDASVAIDQGPLVPGDAITDVSAVGAIEFIGSLSVERRAGLRLTMVGGGLVTEVAGHTIRLGRPVDMAQKASVLDALLDSGIEEGASIDLIAPLRPAVANPRPEVEAEE